ncbi:aminoglycoside phosphotransferase APH(3') [Mycobacterium ulcerans]|uniref:Phosphotransferase n=2 Tax=Mycobacterium ulcerans TaxID=1809 RepID=A0PX08_MYCUA|nr:aminoglycoside phosphotransferase APH(3') [Mycobacterium ulcerans]ABL06877.1 phosphotransferase [Mycobacterium ulcerans Agy99]MEB3904326.1 aminoglycoside phosphotransferase APH(3') [Mycobacterium ulcerans]MEB3908467.1 aminoglycoside phosphotransferase APH(3') [Mycobacterium ulcerans]MEB3918765.1 aminoglycoside phosphotransferase APH(3') [Mycobacterium ulcerans]MEB3922906.1 aminoglycoside phosphotransferase APH(3') [Mycobacterium ulcerans]
MSFPAAPPAVPPVVRRLAAGRPVQAVWANELGGVTFRVGPGAEFIKVARTGVFDFTAEAQRLRWASAHLTVPAVLDFGVEQDWAWLRTAGLPGVSAVHPRWVAAPDVAVRAIGVGLRTLHERLPVRACPFDWSAQSRLARLTAAGRANVGAPPPIDRLVVCHGDACAPHTLIAEDGNCCGHVDLGTLGVADRWADLAVATLSLQWNFPGHGWEAKFFAAYGVAPDPRRIDYYRRLWGPRISTQAKLDAAFGAEHASAVAVAGRYLCRSQASATPAF